MVVGAFPAAKLGALLLKQVSKPIANVLKTQAKNSPVFRKYVCMPPAQFYNWCEIKAKMWILNLGKPVNIPVLNEAMAIELGANLLGEGIIFIIAAGILISEYNRSANKEAAKEEAKIAEMTRLQSDIRELYIQSEEQAAHIRELLRKMGDLDTKLGEKNRTLKSKDDNPETNYNVPRLPLNPPKDSVLQNTTKHVEFRDNSSTTRSSLILRAVGEIENEFWNYPLMEKEESIISLSLYHLKELFKF